MKEKQKKDKTEEFNLQIEPQTELRSFTLRISWPRFLNQSFKSFTGMGDYFEEQEFYRNHLYRRLNRERWPETPINFKSASDSYFLDKHKIKINHLSPPLLADTHPDILPPKIPFYIDLSVKYVDTWHYNLRLVDRFGNESEASGKISFNLPKNTIFEKNYGKKLLVPHTD